MQIAAAVVTDRLGIGAVVDGGDDAGRWSSARAPNAHGVLLVSAAWCGRLRAATLQGNRSWHEGRFLGQIDMLAEIKVEDLFARRLTGGSGRR